MTTERDPDTEPTVEIERPAVPPPAAEIEDVDQIDKDFDPEQTLVREDLGKHCDPPRRAACRGRAGRSCR